MTCIGLQIGPHRVRAVVLAAWPRPRVPVNSPAISDLMDIFDFHHQH